MSAVATRRRDLRLEWTVAGGVIAMATRIAVGGASISVSWPGALAFASILAITVWWNGGTPVLLSARSIPLGIAGAAVLVGLAWLHRGYGPLHVAAANPSLLTWTAVILVIAGAEEMFFRGTLFDLVEGRRGLVSAVVVTSVAFGLIHVPVYGWRAVPLDVAAGVWLAGIRSMGGMPAAITAHVLADLAVGWLI